MRGVYVVFGEAAVEYTSKGDDASSPRRVTAPEAVDEINARRDRINPLLLVTGAPAVLGVALIAAMPRSVVGAIVLLGALLLTVPLWILDRRGRTTYLFYDTGDPRVTQRQALARAIVEAASRARRGWAIASASNIHDWKRNAGASFGVARAPLLLAPGTPRLVGVNIETWVIGSAAARLYLLPEHVLLERGGRLASLPYEAINAHAGSGQFIEEGPVPADTQVVGSTWRFVNRDGGPDRRFRDNRQIPVVRYGELRISAGSDFGIVLQLSSVPAATETARAFAAAGPPSRAVQPIGRPVVGSLAPPSAQGSRPQVEALPAPPRPTPPDVIRAVVTLLKYVALGDRRFGEEERAAICDAVARCVGADPSARNRASLLLDDLRPDAAALAAAVMHIVATIDVEGRVALATAARRIAEADGKITPKERERLDEVTRRLGSGNGEAG